MDDRLEAELSLMQLGSWMNADPLRQPAGSAPLLAEFVSSVAGPKPFSVSVEQRDPAVVIFFVVGEIDLLTEAPLRDHLSGVLATGPQRLIIDLSQVSFLGARALSVLIHVRGIAEGQGTTVQLRAPNRPVAARTLEIAGLGCLFEILPPATDSDQPDSLPSCKQLDTPCTDETDHDGAGGSPLSESPLGTGHEYAHLVPLQRRYAELGADNPEQQQLRERLISGYLPVAEHIARRFAGRGQPLEDLIQVAIVGLINAVDRFEPTRGSQFLSFAVPTITGELRRYFRDYGWSARVPRRIKDLTLAIKSARAQLSQQLGRSPRPSEIAGRLEVPTSQVIEALHAAEAYRSSSLDEMFSSGPPTAMHNKFVGELDAEMSLIDDRQALRPLLAELAPRERTILALRFFHQLTQTQIAEHVGISQMHVSRLLRQTLNFLHDRMASSD
jgi:RNA polymerase sigma-B factor